MVRRANAFASSFKVHVSFSAFILLFLLLYPGAALANNGKADYYRGLDLYHQQDYEGSVKAFQEHLKRVPDDPAAKRWLKKALEQAARAGASVQVDTASLREPAPTPDEAQNDYERGVAFYRQGDFESAIRAFRDYQKRDPKHVPTQQWIALVEAHLASKGAPQFMIEQIPAAAPGLAAAPAGPPHDLAQVQTRFLQELRTKEEALKTAQGNLARAEEDLERVRRKLAMRTQQVARAIRQTKRAIAQTAEAERVSKALAEQMNALGYAHERFTKELETKSAELQSSQEKLARAEEELERLRRESQAVSEARQTTEKRLAEVTREKNERSAKQMKAVHYARARFLEELKANEKALASAASREAELRQERDELRIALRQKTGDKSSMEKALTETEKGLNELMASKEKLAGVIATLRSTQARLQEELAAKESELGQAQASLAQTQKELEGVLAAAKAKEAELTRGLEATKKSVLHETNATAKIQQALLETERRLGEVSAERDALAKEVASLRSNEKRLVAEVGRHEEALARARAEFDDQRKTYQARLAEANSALQATEKSLGQVTNYYQISENSRVEIEKRLSEITRDLKAREAELAAAQSAREAALAASQQREAQFIAKLDGAKKVLGQREEEAVRLEAARRSAEERVQAVLAEKTAAETARALLGQERQALEIEVQTARARAEELAVAIGQREEEIARLRKVTEGRIREMQDKIADLDEERQAAREAKIAADERALDIQTKLQATGESLGQTERALGQISKNLQLSEEARRDVERRLTQALAEKEAAEQAGAGLRENEARLGAEIRDREARIAELESRAARDRQALEAGLAEARQAQAAAERTLAQVTQYYQMSENARIETERKLAEAAAGQSGLRAQIRKLTDSRESFGRELEGTRLELERTREELAGIRDRLEAERRDAAAKLEAATRGREALESQVLLATRHEAEARAQVEKLRGEMSRMLPQLQSAMRALAEPAGDDRAASE